MVEGRPGAHEISIDETVSYSLKIRLAESQTSINQLLPFISDCMKSSSIRDYIIPETTSDPDLAHLSVVHELRHTLPL